MGTCEMAKLGGGVARDDEFDMARLDIGQLYSSEMMR